VRLLVDTGASNTCVVSGLLSPLGVTPSGQIPMHSASTGGMPVNCSLFDVSLIFAFPGTMFTLPTVAVNEIAPMPQGTIQGLLGRDVLSLGQFHYHGQIATFCLSF
jgi:hypothetical protein